MSSSTATSTEAAADTDREPTWVRSTFALLLLGTAVLWTIGLGRNGWANSFYSAAVQAGSQSWKAMLFGSSDAANSITVDKPPASLWPMEISARIFGLNSWSILLPQVLLGVASVALLHVIVKRGFGPAAGLLAGGVLALTPVATLMFRFNNPDALLVFLMVASVWALLCAVEDGRTRWLVLCGSLLGLGFLTKQLQVLLVVPGLALAYLIAGPPKLKTRFAQLIAGLAAMVAAAGWWVALVELWPKDSRPYIGGSTDNSFLDLTFGYNGLGRLTGHEGGMFPSGGPGGPGGPDGPGGGPGPGVFGSPAGITRMFSGESGGQISWLLPAALILLIVGIALCARRTRTDPQRAQYVVWGCWLLVTMVVFSSMSGIFHDYYTVALAPAVAALVGIGVVSLWRLRDNVWAAASLAALSVLTAAWAWVLLGRTPDFVPWLRWAVLAVGVVSAAAMVFAPNMRAWAAGLAVVAALAGPLAYCIDTISGERSGPIVTAGPSMPGRGMFPGGDGPQDPTGPGGSTGGGPGPMMMSDVPDAVVDALADDAGSYTWVAAVQGSAEAANYQLAVGDPVMPLGGFLSADPAPTLEQFKDRVADGRVHYYIESRGPGPGFDNSSEASRIRDWVESTYTELTVDGVVLYDLTEPV